MVQNRNKLISLFIGNISNAILHDILEKAINNEEISGRYHKESSTSFGMAKKYREKINPISSAFPYKDISFVKTGIINKVRAELLQRISKGYKGIDIDSIEKSADKALKDVNVI